MDFNSLRSSQNDMKNLGSDDMKRAFIAAAEAFVWKQLLSMQSGKMLQLEFA